MMAILFSLMYKRLIISLAINLADWRFGVALSDNMFMKVFSIHVPTLVFEVAVIDSEETMDRKMADLEKFHEHKDE